MRIGFISDIHGNYEALKSVLRALDNMNVSKIFCLGDVVGYYSQVNECCDELRSRNIPCLMGNHDWYMAGGGLCLRSKSVNDCINYQKTIISDENLNWIRSFEIQFIHGAIHMVHGGWADPIDEYLQPSEEYFAAIDGEFFFSGHTHVQMVQYYKKKTYCNPGSVGQPRDNDPRAAFAVLDGDIFLHRTDYDMQTVFDLMEKAGFNDYYYGSLKTGAKNLRKLEL
jgi:putative phosphoesterase